LVGDAHNPRTMRWLAVVLASVAVAVSCSSESPTFTLTGVSVDSTHWCPGGATDAKYDVHAAIHVHNGTPKAVAIESATADMVLASVKGGWLEPVGDRYDAGTVSVTPAKVAPNSSATLEVTIPSSCTSGPYGSTLSSSGSYKVTVRLVTSAGKFTAVARNRHEILAA
jgi:hypothetical protein